MVDVIEMVRTHKWGRSDCSCHFIAFSQMWVGDGGWVGERGRRKGLHQIVVRKKKKTTGGTAMVPDFVPGAMVSLHQELSFLSRS